ncbi:type I restriction-modification system subunit M [Corynebacterium amycolatum]|uniref:type I restriction-modification system subunit M n=1 Tax=Corynebacterium amycolatum TaxID=43765 RepID=UPI00234CADC6|nr:class I SAM-dependent DNA methyltransferase [Corynebacterium amycolatum]MDC7118880.1 class I SAM-dependent DNA methyltransferase [Corynebacterium amycolatum]
MSQFDVQKQVDHVFSIANSLRGTYQADKYKDVIIPMTIIRRLECALEESKDAVCTVYEQDKSTPDVILKKVSGYPFYNTSRYTLEKLLAEPAQLHRNLKTYLDAFSPNIRMILDKNDGLDFGAQIDKMHKGARLTGVVRKFSELELSPERISNVAMGYMFEEIIRRFSENAEAGDHYTPREVVRLLVRIGLAEGSEDLFEPGKNINVADVACGTGGMLSVAREELGDMCPEASVYVYGQEVNPESHAICLADMLIKNQRANSIQLADTMKEDCFPGEYMRLQFVNPPFGQPWGGKDAATGVEKAVKAEHSKSASANRFPAGLPAKGDMQLLFMQHIVYKMEERVGRACVISNGSPLFSGSTSSGESQVRRWLLEHDYIEAIIALPGSLFYNTDISIYVWVLSKNKRLNRKGKVQLIDASNLWTPMRRSLGKKRRYIADSQIDQIVAMYTDFAETEQSKIVDADEFLYHEYAIYKPLQRNYCITEERIAKLAEGKFSDTMHNPAKLEELRLIDPADRDTKQSKNLAALEMAEPVFEQILDMLRENITDQIWQDSTEFIKHLRAVLADLPDHRVKQTSNQTKAMLEKIADRLSEPDKTAPIRHDRKGNIILDPTTKDLEIVPLTVDIEDYMEREVLPYVPDAVWVDEEDEDKIRTGAEIPFARYFYQFQEPEPSEALMKRFFQLEEELAGILGEIL